jgi:hypothetical protein
MNDPGSTPLSDRLDTDVLNALRTKVADQRPPEPAALPSTAAEPPQGCLIEIVERIPAEHAEDYERGPGILVPTEIRINGTPVLAPADRPVIVHQINIGHRAAVEVTLTLFARMISIHQEVDDA